MRSTDAINKNLVVLSHGLETCMPCMVPVRYCRTALSLRACSVYSTVDYRRQQVDSKAYTRASVAILVGRPSDRLVRVRVKTRAEENSSGTSGDERCSRRK